MIRATIRYEDFCESRAGRKLAEHLADAAIVKSIGQKHRGGV